MRTIRWGFLGILCIFGVGVSPAVLAGGLDYGPQASLYLSYAFDGTEAHDFSGLTGLRYGLRLDHDWWRQRPANDAPLLRWQFRRAGFDHLSVGGVPIADRRLIMNAEGGATGFLKENFGPIALTVAGAVVIAATIDAESDSGDRDTGDIDGPGSVDDRDPEFDCDAEPRTDFCSP